MHDGALAFGRHPTAYRPCSDPADLRDACRQAMIFRDCGADPLTLTRLATHKARGLPAPLPSEMAEHYVYGAGQPSEDHSYYAQQGSAGGPAPGHHYGNAHLRPCTGVVQFRGHGAGSFVHAAATEYGYDQHGAAAYYVAVPDHSQTVLYGSVPYPTQAQQAYMVRCCRQKLLRAR